VTVPHRQGRKMCCPTLEPDSDHGPDKTHARRRVKNQRWRSKKRRTICLHTFPSTPSPFASVQRGRVNPTHPYSLILEVILIPKDLTKKRAGTKIKIQTEKIEKKNLHSLATFSFAPVSAGCAKVSTHTLRLKSGGPNEGLGSRETSG
jgi:hypothetical protein